jgi:hypothetical protein
MEIHEEGYTIALIFHSPFLQNLQKVKEKHRRKICGAMA